jgi:hypothetical protein
LAPETAAREHRFAALQAVSLVVRRGLVRDQCVIVGFHITPDAVKSVSGIAISAVFLYHLIRRAVRSYFRGSG